MATELLLTGKHTVTALTRPDSNSELPQGIIVAKVDYDNEASLVEALRGQDALVITLSVRAPPETQSRLIRAAGAAGVPWILPNDWSPDTTNEGLLKDVPTFAKGPTTRAEIEKLGKSSFINMATSFWYEWSLAIPDAYGFDFAKRTVVLFDEGEVKICTSTWPQIGRAVAKLLSLPIKPEGGDVEHSLDHYRNKVVYVSSFTVSQKDMLDSVLRVTNTKLEDWSVSKEDSHTRWSEGMKAMKTGNQQGFARMLYSRIFFPDGSGDFEKSKGLLNGILGLPKEDMDEATKRAIKRSETVPWP